MARPKPQESERLCWDWRRRLPLDPLCSLHTFSETGGLRVSACTNLKPHGIHPQLWSLNWGLGSATPVPLLPERSLLFPNPWLYARILSSFDSEERQGPVEEVLPADVKCIA